MKILYPLQRLPSGAGLFHSQENRDFDSCSAKNVYLPTDDFTGALDIGAATGGSPYKRMKQPCPEEAFSPRQAIVWWWTRHQK
ncbi:hypothetical protein [Microcoleus sp. Pol7_B2]|uniref:hypothetical protein n=1 Tax=Microcoleus sp. Pol7_B2 TaxID=2818895 RepID=UPI002FD45075